MKFKDLNTEHLNVEIDAFDEYNTVTKVSNTTELKKLIKTVLPAKTIDDIITDMVYTLEHYYKVYDSSSKQYIIIEVCLNFDNAICYKVILEDNENPLIMIRYDKDKKFIYAKYVTISMDDFIYYCFRQAEIYKMLNGTNDDAYIKIYAYTTDEGDKSWKILEYESFNGDTGYTDLEAFIIDM